VQNSSGGQRREDRSISVLGILLIPRIWFSFSTFIVATVCNGFLSINLEPKVIKLLQHRRVVKSLGKLILLSSASPLKVLRQFDLAPAIVGLIFGLKDGGNSIASPIWGVLCDRNRQQTVKPFMVVSGAIVAFSFFLLGASNVTGIHLKM